MFLYEGAAHDFCRFINYCSDPFFADLTFFSETYFFVTDCMEWIIWNGLPEYPAGLYDLSFDKK